MKTAKFIFITIFLSFITNSISSKNLNYIDPRAIIEKLEIIKPIFIYPEIYTKIRYNQFRLTTINLLETYAFLLQEQSTIKSKKLEFYTEIIADFIIEIDEQITEIIKIFSLEIERRNDPENQINNTNLNESTASLLNSQSTIQAHQQNVISNLLATVEQSNNAISQFSNSQSYSKNRWKKIKIIAIATLSSIAFLAVIITVFYAYKKINAIFQDDYEKLDKKVNEAEEFLLKTQKLTAEAIGETKNGLNNVGHKIKEAEIKLDHMIKDQIHPLNKKLNKSIQESQFFMLHKKDHDEMSKKINEIGSELQRLGGIVIPKENTKNILLNKTSQNSNLLKEVNTNLTLMNQRIEMLEKNYVKLLRQKHKRGGSFYED